MVPYDLPREQIRALYPYSPHARANFPSPELVQISSDFVRRQKAMEEEREAGLHDLKSDILVFDRLFDYVIHFFSKQEDMF